ncbi:unnamed protein product [Gadus morhua 'NCC']
MPVQTNKNALENTDLAHVNQYSSPAPPIEQRGRQGDEEDEHGGRQGETGGCPSAEGDSLIRSSNHQDPKVGIQGKEINDRNTLQAARKSEFQKTFEVPQKCGFKRPAACCWTRSLPASMMCSQMRWLLVIQLLLTEQALCRSTSPLAHRSAPLPSSNLQDGDGSTRPARQSVLGSRPHGGFKHFPVHEGQRIHSAKRMISLLREKLVGRIHNHIQSQENVSCEELLSASTMEDPRSPLFPQELLGLSLVPVLAVADCHQEAVALMLQLYDLLGVADTEELLVEVEALIERRISRAVASTAAAAAATSPPPPAETQRVDEMQMEAVMFNIQQLARESKTLQGTSGREKHWEVCEGWAQVNGTLLLGKAVEGPSEGLEEALRACESLGLQCAGIAHGGGGGGLLKACRSKYSAVLKKGSRVVPAADSSDCWLRLCRAEKEPWSPAAGRRWRRGADADDHCSDRKEQNIYSVVEWIPAVSTLYSLGTAMYYASLNCTETARERALLSAVDLGTDALMAVTGGTAGVAGYALGAGVKTGVKASLKYLLGSMKDEDLLVNQYTWEEEVLRMQED